LGFSGLLTFERLEKTMSVAIQGAKRLAGHVKHMVALGITDEERALKTMAFYATLNLKCYQNRYGVDQGDSPISLEEIVSEYRMIPSEGFTPEFPLLEYNAVDCSAEEAVYPKLLRKIEVVLEKDIYQREGARHEGY
jgi:hypothetical protein